MERALLVTVRLRSEKNNWPLEDSAYELEELVSTAKAEVVDNIASICDKPTPNFFIGRGKVQELAFLCRQENIQTVIFSHNLSGTHQRNLEEAIAAKVIDRTQLIMDIFARHARSPEGKMQVELAQLEYLLPRLSGKGIMLSRLGGGIGTRGPGEQKLETDRRRIRKRIDKLKNDLNQLIFRRKTLRKKRQENALPCVALVGYTNAGKSTLMNALAGCSQYVEEGLFTTLDPLSKALKMANGENIIISDTVGFLHNLPHNLIEAFKATLEEVTQADLLIHVLDASHPRILEHAEAVRSVLKEIGADKNPVITALNKIDLLDDKMWLSRLVRDFPDSVAISAKFKDNLGGLLDKLQVHFQSRMALIEAVLPHSRMDLLDLFYRQGKVKEIKYLAKGIKIKANLPKNLIFHLTDIEKMI